MCGEIDAEITRLEAIVRWQRKALESIFEAWDEHDDYQNGATYKQLSDVITAARSASTMTGTSEE